MFINNRDKVLELIDILTVIVGHVSTEYVYRGESECHDYVSSSLYRELYEIDNQFFDIKEAQQRQLDQAKQFTKETNDLAILAEIQHRGGKTNLIDFTTDLNIALFFACKFSPDIDGRIILLDGLESEDYTIHRAVHPSNMADVQKSVFVIPKKGYINESDVIVYPIPHELKVGVLDYLEAMHGITLATVYNDISGFIRHQREFQDHEAEFYAGQRSLNENDFDKAIAHLTTYIEHPATLWQRGRAYYLRGITHYILRRYTEAMQDLKNFNSRQWGGKPELPADIRKFFDKQIQMEEEERERHSLSQVNEEAPGVIHRVRLDARDPHGNFVDGVTFMLLSEYGYSYRNTIFEKILVTVPSPCVEGKWRYWFNKDGYQGFNAMEVTWGEPFTLTMQPKGRNAHLPQVTLDITYTTQ